MVREQVVRLTERYKELLKSTGRAGIEDLSEANVRANFIDPLFDLEFFRRLNRWRLALANDIYEGNKDGAVLKNADGELDLDRLKDAVQRTLDRLIIIRWAEDNLVIEDPNILQRKYDDWKQSPSYSPSSYSLFADRTLCDRFNEIHDGKIFERGHICEQVKITDAVLGEIIKEMNSISYRKFDLDLLGSAYESYLGHTLYQKDDGRIELLPSQELCKESGIYYTPPYVVDYIIRNTLGELLKDKTPDEVDRIKVLDPACGSGSFLIKAFDYFKKYYEEENEKIRAMREAKIKEYLRSSGNQLNFEMEALECAEHRDIDKKILKNNIFGVDLDRQAAEIASVNLMLKALSPNEKLPLILDENIRVGNSLISGSEEELREYFGDDWIDKKSFNWEEVFRGKFDVIVGNPPWVSFGLRAVGKLGKDMDRYLRDTYPHSAEYKLSVYAIFINRAIDLLENGGIFGFIVPDSFLLGRYFSKLRRYILNEVKIKEMLLILEDFWPHGTVGRSVIIILQKESDEDSRRNNEVIATLCPTLEYLGKRKFKRYSYEQNYFEKIQYNRFRLFFDEESKEFVDRREEGTIKLHEIVSIHTGVRSKIGQKNIYSKEKKGDTWKRGLISGSEIGRYSLTYSGFFLNIDPELLWSGGWDPDVVERDKLIMRQTGDSIYATFDDNKLYHLNNCHSIVSRNPDYNLKYILAILNSKLMNHYYHLISLELGRVMAQTDIETIEQLPIKPATQAVQQEFVILVDEMLALKNQSNEINTTISRYIDVYPRTKDGMLKDYTDKLSIKEKEVLKDHYGRPANQIEGNIKKFEIIEEGEWLIFIVDYIFLTRRGKDTLIKNVRANKCRLEDENLRKFVYYCIKEYITPSKLGTGNIYERILGIKIPRFSLSEEENRKIIDELMGAYLDEVRKSERIEKDIEDIDRKIDERVYELYGLGGEEIKMIEESA